LWEDNIGEEEEWMKISRDIKINSCIENDFFKKKNHKTTAAQVTEEMNIRLEDHVYIKTVGREYLVRLQQ
jgi:hypothetical protein